MVEDLIYRIAARCEPVVWARISATAINMDPPQAHGYIRARATLVINREVCIATAKVPEATDAIVQRVKRGVADSLVRSMLGAIAKQHPSQFRRAA